MTSTRWRIVSLYSTRSMSLFSHTKTIHALILKSQAIVPTSRTLSGGQVIAGNHRPMPIPTLRHKKGENIQNFSFSALLRQHSKVLKLFLTTLRESDEYKL
nr:hypothetical protein [Ktedonobacteraceae bacterium]